MIYDKEETKLAQLNAAKDGDAGAREEYTLTLLRPIVHREITRMATDLMHEMDHLQRLCTQLPALGPTAIGNELGPIRAMLLGIGRDMQRMEDWLYERNPRNFKP